ncbi:MAG TPA: hypothetical protein VNO81_01670 [Candidatus Nitrosotenuis sp.]|jgi:DNA-binding response OmpR family regulator|nr:hypothetical protein [Candidatus Nitrosotenuis sp.]
MNVLLVEPRAGRAAAFEKILRQGGAEVETVPSVAQALPRMGAEGLKGVVVSRWLPEMSGSTLAGLVRVLNRNLPVAVVEDPDKEKGILENLLRSLAPPEGQAP